MYIEFIQSVIFLLLENQKMKKVYALIGFIGKLINSILPKNLILPILTGKSRGKKWIVASSNISCYIGIYELDKKRLFEQEIQKSSVVYDIGANTGFYTLLASELVGNEGKVIAFEPFPENIFVLKKHTEINNLENVMIMEVAVSNENGKSFFSIAESSSEGCLVSKKTEKTIEVPTVSIDDLISKKIILPPNYIKIDVEGAELNVLNGAKKTLSEFKPKIFLATHDDFKPNIHSNCVEFLKSCDYKIVPIGSNNLLIANELFAY